MKLSDFPRPRLDNGRGIHWSARVYHPAGRELDFWIDELQAMQIKWVKLLDDGDGSAVDLCQRLIQAEIMPVVRLYRERPNPSRMGGRERSGLAKLLAAGVHYFETNNEPDLPAEWENDHKPDNWLDIVTDNFIHDADMILAAGGLPGVPAMGPGGRENVVQKAVDRGRRDLFERGAWFAIHNYTLNHPLDYPDDPVNQQGTPLTQAEYDHFGPWAWDHRPLEMINELRVRAANPGHTIEDDPNCFRGWERAGSAIHAALGFHIPVISTEGGPVVGWGDDKRYPKMIPSQQAEFQVAILRFMQEEAPEWYFACCTWLLAARPLGDWNPTWDQMGWYTDAWNERFGLAGRLPVVHALKETPSRPRPDVRVGSAALAGTIRREDTGAPLPHVTLWAVGENATVHAASDAQGHYRLERLSPGAYSLQVAGTEWGRANLGEGQSLSHDVSVAAGAFSQIHGQAVDPADAPQAGLSVWLVDAAAPSAPLAETATDGAGRFRFDGLSAGSYGLEVAAGTPQATRHPAIQVNGWDGVTVLVVTPAAPGYLYTAQARLLSPEETGNRNAIFGVVTDAGGAPLQGKTVRMRWTGAAAETRFPTVLTGHDPFKPAGYYEFMHTPGVFMVEVVDPEWESQTAQDLITADRAERARPISYEVNFRLRPLSLPPQPQPQPEPEPHPQPLAHYVLLAPAPASLTGPCLLLALDFIAARQATVGFDPAVARQAKRVTVIGTRAAEWAWAAALREGGVQVEQVAADPFTLQRALEALP